MKNKKVIVIIIVVLIILIPVSAIISYNLGKSSAGKLYNTNIQKTEDKESTIHMIKKMPDDILKSYSKSYIGDERLYYLKENDGIYEPANTLTSNTYYIFKETITHPYIEVTKDKEIFYFPNEKLVDEYLKSK